MCDHGLQYLKRPRLVQLCKQKRTSRDQKCSGKGATNEAIRFIVTGIICNEIAGRASELAVASDTRRHDLEERLREANTKAVADADVIQRLREEIVLHHEEVMQSTQLLKDELRELEEKRALDDMSLRYMQMEKEQISLELESIGHNWSELLQNALYNNNNNYDPYDPPHEDVRQRDDDPYTDQQHYSYTPYTAEVEPSAALPAEELIAELEQSRAELAQSQGERRNLQEETSFYFLKLERIDDALHDQSPAEAQATILNILYEHEAEGAAPPSAAEPTAPPAAPSAAPPAEELIAELERSRAQLAQNQVEVRHLQEEKSFYFRKLGQIENAVKLPAEPMAILKILHQKEEDVAEE
tara:strand:- start:95 stop:1162 length:1068 start_codon:yes stop_codon:yes gene_type:complete